jgi:redox-sensitive bicupin YhaK (pirin superfamily)
MEIRQIKRVVRGRSTMDGAGVKLIRVLGGEDTREIDPFLMMDAFDSTNPDDYVRGFPMHPHRGIETVTYLIKGRIDHEDSLGNSGTIAEGESQWMTSGSGILHQEMPQPSDRIFGLQMWLNLPQKDKMTQPAYFDISRDMIKVHEVEQGTVRVIAGSYADTQGVSPKFVKATMLDIALRPDQAFQLPVHKEANLFIYLLEGGGAFDTESSKPLERRTAAIFGSGDTLQVKSGAEGAHFMVFYGKPLREPIAWAGPIVMNTEEELQQAFDELHTGTFIR